MDPPFSGSSSWLRCRRRVDPSSGSRHDPSHDGTGSLPTDCVRRHAPADLTARIGAGTEAAVLVIDHDREHVAGNPIVFHLDHVPALAKPGTHCFGYTAFHAETSRCLAVGVEARRK